MIPVSPVVPGCEETIYGKNQPQYHPLPAVRLHGFDGTIVTRWRPSWVDRLRLLFGGSLYLSVMTFHQPLQPVLLETTPPNLGLPGEAQ